MVYLGDLIMHFLIFLSGRNKMIKHFGTNIHNSNPKLEAKMANISTATVNFPGELTCAGMNESHTAQNMIMLKVMSLASLKVSGSLRPRKARRRQREASRPM